MAEILSPNPAKQRGPMASRLQSPTSPLYLGSNDDKLERAQARAARAAAIRRKSIVPDAFLRRGAADPDPCLDQRQILELFQNCIKLASENKINQKNTWELSLIDHLAEIIHVEEEKDMETNFQKASCTLEAGVKIYSYRVDSLHSEAYKVLGGMNRAGQENEQDSSEEPGNADGGQEVRSKKETEKKISPLSTLEPSFEALNVKKFDVAFAVDPLYHQTSAQFDEGGAKGLLMNNLGVYGGCKILFDSQEVPGKCISCDELGYQSETIDLSFAKDCIEQMVLNMRNGEEISPSLGNIISRFDEGNRRPSDVYNLGEKPVEYDLPNEAELDHGENEDCVTWSQNQEDETTMVDEGPDFADSSFPDDQEENEPYTSINHSIDDRFEKVDEYLFLSLGLASKQNSWAGPEHWKFQKAKASEVDSGKENAPEVTSKKKKNQKVELDINFTKPVDKDFSDIFAPPKNPKSLLLPANKASSNTKLPEDCHYQPEDLVKLFLLPNLKCLGRRSRKFSDESGQQTNDFGQGPMWDDESRHGDYFDHDNVESEEEDSSTLVSQPRQVNKIEVQYDKTSKQVDVQALKETLWDQLQDSHQVPEQDHEKAVSFKKMLERFPSDCGAAATISDISPHLCFICVLHLANEHGLKILGNSNMDDLRILFPH